MTEVSEKTIEELIERARAFRLSSGSVTKVQIAGFSYAIDLREIKTSAGIAEILTPDGDVYVVPMLNIQGFIISGF